MDQILAITYNGSATLTLTEHWQEVGPVTATPTSTSTPIRTASATATSTTATSAPMSTATPTNTNTPVITNAPSVTETPCAITFTDVHPSDYFCVPVTYLYRHGVISGYADGTFRPYNNVTRGQLSKIVVLAEDWTLLNPPTPTFSDVPNTNPFFQHVETAYSHNIISGYSCGTGCLEFRPGNNATRGQISKIVYLAITGP